MLRTSEFLVLTDQHVLVHPQQSALSVVLPSSKTSAGNPQVLQVEAVALVAMAQECRRSMKKARLFFPDGPTSLRDTFQRLLRRLHFPVGSYQPYTLRRGGATWFYQTTLGLDATVTRGCWSCQKTARQYVDSGTMQLAHLTWSPKQVHAVRKRRLKGAKLRLRQTARRWT